MSDRKVRVRFAPSPTGPLHLGGVRTALYNFLFARKHGGQFLLRIEDTDQNRFVPGAEAYITESLTWCGLTPDEDPVSGGPHAPYRQSERTGIYLSHLQQLLERGHAYYAFDTPEELESLRATYSSHKEPFQYNAETRLQLCNSLTLSADEVQERLNNGVPNVVRALIPSGETVVFRDMIRGDVEVQTSTLDDKVLFKSDGLPTYHLANVVDDHLMEITHVIRGEEWLPSAPLHLLLYRFFGWESEMPEFAHLPLILKPDGQGKLSKRDGDRLGFPVFPIQWKDPATGEISRGFREEGYLPDAFINMLALLGWNPGTEQELLSREELTQLFSIERTHKSGSRFDPEKALWFNQQYFRQMPYRELSQMLIRLLALKNSGNSSSGSSTDTSASSCHPFDDPEYALRIVPLIRERLTLIPDLESQSRLFYFAPDHYDAQSLQKFWKPDTPGIISQFLEVTSQEVTWNPESLHLLISEFTASHGLKPGQLMMPLRLLIVGSNQGPGMTDVMAIVGRDETLKRIQTGLRRCLNKNPNDLSY